MPQYRTIVKDYVVKMVLQENIGKLFIKYVVLNVLGMIGFSCYVLADTFFIAGGIGADGLAALNIALPVYSLVHGSGLMIGIGGATRFSISGDERVFTQSIRYMLFLSSIFVVIGIFFAEKIAVLLGADSSIVGDTTDYMRIMLLFSPAFMLNNVVSAFVRNDGNPRLSMTGMLAGSLFNIVMDYILIYPCGLGMLGAALATGMSPVISMLIQSRHFVNKKNTFRFNIRYFKPGFSGFADISRLGISAFINEMSSAIVIIVFNFLILRLEGNVGVAAYGVITNIALVVMAVFTGISQGIQPLISRYYAAEDETTPARVLKYGIITAVCIAFVTYILSYMFTGDIVMAFNSENNRHLTDIASDGIRLYFTAFIFAGINVLLATYYSAVDKPKMGFFISFSRGFAVIIPVAVILAYLFKINGVWMSVTATEILVLLMSMIIIFIKSRKDKKR